MRLEMAWVDFDVLCDDDISDLRVGGMETLHILCVCVCVMVA